MKRNWLASLWVCLLLLQPFRASAQQCSDCDCNHFPIKDSCETCCGVAIGKVTAVQQGRIEVAVKPTSGRAVKRSFSVSSKTKKAGTPRPGQAVSVYFHRHENLATRIDVVSALNNLLTPAGMTSPPMPPSCRAVPPDAVRVYLGSNAAWSTMDHFTVFRVGSTDLLEVQRTERGLAIYAKVFDEDGRLGAQIVDNRFYLNRRRAFALQVPDRHSLRVVDRRGRLVFGITFLNSHSVAVSGRFDVRGHAPISVGPLLMRVGRMEISNACFGNAATIFRVR